MLKWKHATLWGVILWVLIFAAFSVIMFTPALQGKQSTQDVLELIILAVLVVLSAKMYFGNTKATAKDGLVVGVYFLVISTILDLLITIPLFVKSYSAFYTQWTLWAGFLETVVFSALVGHFQGKMNQ